MEMENKKPSLPMEKLIFQALHCIFDILNKALILPFKILKFVANRFYVFLPLICTSFIHNLILNEIFIEMSYRIRQLPMDTSITNWVVNITLSFLKHTLLYIVLAHLLVVLTASATIFFLEIRASEGEKKLRGTLMQKHMIEARWKKPLIKFACVSFMCFFGYTLVVSWLVIGLLKTSDFIFFSVLYVVSFIAILMRWLEFNAMWNLCVARSNLEDKRRFEALSLKESFFAEGPWSLRLSSVFPIFYWCFETSISNIHFRVNYGGLIFGGIIAALLYIGLIWKKLI